MNRPSVHGGRIFWRPFVIILAALVPAAFADEDAGVNNIPLSLDELSGRIVTKVVMGEGQPQTVSFAVSTGMRYSAVRSTACTDCIKTNAFNPSLSTTFQAVDGNATDRYGGVDFSGGLMRENCGLVRTNPGVWSWPNQTLVVSRPSAASVLSDAITGVMGLGTSAPPGGEVTDTVLGSWLRRNPANNSFDIGFALNDLAAVIKRQAGDNEEDTGAGRLHFAAPNESYFDPSTLVWSSASNSVIGPSGDDSGGFPSDFVFTLDNWTFTGPNQFTISSDQDAQATFEPLLPAIIFPSRFANSIAGSISGAQEVAYSDPKQWTVPCETTGLKWTATYAGLPIPAENLVHKRPDGSCVGVIQGWKDESVNSFLLGSPAMANAYIIHQTTQDGDNKVGVASRVFPKRSASSRAGLIGGVVGGVIAAILIVGVVLFIFRKKLRREERTYVNENAPVTPFMSETAASAPATATVFPLGPPTAVSVVPSQYGHVYSPVPVTDASSSADVGGTFAAQQSAALSNMRDAKGRQMYTAAAPAADSNLYPRSPSPSADSSALSSVPSSRRPMLPPAYQG